MNRDSLADNPQNPYSISVQSFSLHHFPHIIHRNGERLLWNPLLRKAFKNLPEERVRLQTLEFLLRDAKWPSARISCETAIRNVTEEANTVRADMICYDQNFKPAIIIECKAPTIRLTGSTARQIAGYNRKVKAPYLYLTNGISDIFVKTGDDGASALPISSSELFGPILPSAEEESLTYYVERGFAGDKSSPVIMNWLRQALPLFHARRNNGVETRFLDIGHTPEGEALSHYYQLHTLDKSSKLALTFMTGREGETRLVAIRNEGGANTGIVDINLELMAAKDKECGTLYHEAGSRKLDLSGLIDFTTFDNDHLYSLADRLGDKLQ